MEELILKSGGRLELTTHELNEQTDKSSLFSFDVTIDAAAYLMDAVRFEGEIYLRDIFALLECNPTLVHLFRRQHAEDYLKVAKTEPATPYTGEYDPDEIEYLELQPDWNNNDQTGELVVNHRFSITAVGYELLQDIELNEYIPHKAGTRIRWSIMGSPLPDLLNFPLRFDGRISLAKIKGTNQVAHDDDLTSVVLTPSLFQIIDGILWELSFCGDTEQTAGFVDELLKTKANTETWSSLNTEEILHQREAD